MSTARRQSWFATLRRDRGLFALAGSLLLLLGLLQPLAAAQGARSTHWTICTTDGIRQPGGAQDRPLPVHERSPVCLAGNACTGAPAAKAAPAADPAFPAPRELAAPPVDAGPQPAIARRAGEPPAIRAPPVLSA